MQNTKKVKKTLNVADDLELEKITVPEIPKDIIFPDELNRYLRDQVQYLTHENAMLYKNLSSAELQVKESETKIKSLSSQLEEYQTVNSNNSITYNTANLASSKIVELSKKLRERNSEVEVYKTKCSKLENRINELQRNNNPKEENIISVTRPGRPKNELEDQIKTLQDKLSNTTSKLCETRNSNTQLKNELKVANKLLQQEVGESFEALSLSINSGNWRGRAQVICDLQQKNIDLKEKLKVYKEKEKNQNNSEFPMQVNKQIDKRLDTLSKENSELKSSLQDMQKKLDASKARNRVLELECSGLRNKVSVISEQDNHNQDMIAALTTRVSRSQELQNEAVLQKETFIKKLNQENKILCLQVAKLTCKLDNQEVQIKDQKREIEILNEKVKRPQSFKNNVSEPVDSKYTQMQAERVRLLELNKLTNERLEAERVAHAAIQAKFRIERQKTAKLEAKVAYLELDQKVDRNSSYSISSVKSKESDISVEDRLELAEETIKALETRLQIEKQEHKTDVNEFTKILENYGCSKNSDSNYN